MSVTIVEDFPIDKYAFCTLKELGNITELVYQNAKNHAIKIRKLNDTEYLNLVTGEILKFNRTFSRKESINFLRVSLKNLRDYINFNVTDLNKVKWITLTYKENMTDTKRLYKDFEKFIKRFRYQFKQYKVEYIVAMEPQARGAWHCHLLLLFDKRPRFY